LKERRSEKPSKEDHVRLKVTMRSLGKGKPKEEVKGPK
jgi:hypothetical protein